jgi:hypothetical protein
MTKNSNVFFFEIPNPNFLPRGKVIFLPKFAGIPGSRQRYPLNFE